MELLIIIGLVLLNGIFAMAEMSLVSSRRFKLENALKKGSKAAKTALELAENPTRFLSTVQIGITLIGILLGVYSGENLTNDVQAFLEQFELLQPYAPNIAVVVIVVFVTYLSIVLGELLPKRIGLTFPEPIAMLLARPMRWLSLATSPFVWLLTTTNDVILKILGIKSGINNKVTEEEIKAIIRESADGGEIQDIEQNIVERVFELGDRKVVSLMTHRNHLVFFDEKDDWPTLRRKVGEEKHSAYPVGRDGNIDHLKGIVLLEDLFDHEHDLDWKQHIKQPLFVGENMPVYQLLELFKKKQQHYGVVVDEFGATKGMVTMDDVLDALVGNSEDAIDESFRIVQRDENSWLVDGQYPFSAFQKQFNLPVEVLQQGNFHTVAGFILTNANTLPKAGDRFEFGPLHFEIVDMDGQRIDKVLITSV